MGRSRRRTAVLAGAVAFSVFTFVGSMAFMDAFSIEMVASAVDLQGGHVQIASKGYDDDPQIERRIADPATVLATARTVPGARVAAEVMTSGMANSTEQSGGVVIHGVDPGLEAGVSAIPDRLDQGAWLDPNGGSDQVVVGSELADRLRVGLGEKIVLMASDVDNEVSAGAYRITGLFRSGSTSFDRTQVFILLPEAQRLLGFGDEVSTVTVRLDHPEESVRVASELETLLEDPHLEVLTWQERVPLIEMARKAYDWSALITALVLFTAVGFTLLNSFLMVVYERIQELGIMLAQGVKPAWIRRVLYLEALIVTVLGVAAGAVISVAVLGFWIRNGVDLSSFAQGLNYFNVRTVIYPYLHWGHLSIGLGTIVVLTWLAVLYPAIKASRFEAVEAINHV